MKAHHLKPLYRGIELDEVLVRLNQIISALKEQDERISALETNCVLDAVFESPEGIAALVERARELMGAS